MKAVRIFKDLVSFLTIIPLAKDAGFLETSARYMFLFPLVGGMIGLLASAYFYFCVYILSFLFAFLNGLFAMFESLLVRIFSSVMTLAFLLVLTGLQHFDGLVDLGNVLGLKTLKEREIIARAWIVTYKGVILAFFVEFLTFLGIFLLNFNFAFNALIYAEVMAKLAMVTVAWVGRATPGGKGAIFAVFNHKKRINFAAYAISLLIAFPLLGFLGLALILVIFSLGVFMAQISERLFKRISGDILGATNEIGRALCLLLIALMVRL